MDLSLNSFLTQVATGDKIKDFQHGTRLFVDSLYRLSPKYSFLFHVFIDINPTAAQTTNRIDINQQIEIGMLAKTVSLPKFTIKNKTYNSYNRKSVIQDSITYDPINLSFHDDSADVVRGFWGDYYSYYYRDGDYPEALYKQGYKYQPNQAHDWGFTPKNPEKYISAIRIYSLHQKSFSGYTLINPMITSFKHGEHTQGQNETMQHEMTVAYEGVQYITGPVINGLVQGFDVIHYDNSPSPLSPYGGGTTSFLGPGGMFDSAGSILTNLSEGNFLAAAIIGGRQYTNFKDANFGQTAQEEFATMGLNILRGQNSQSTIFAPTAAAIRDAVSSAITPTPTASSLLQGAVNNINNQNSLGN